MRLPIRSFLKELKLSSYDLSRLKPLIFFLHSKKCVSHETYQKSVDFLISKTNGSQFQQSVWREILKIRLGMVARYIDIATNLQNPKC